MGETKAVRKGRGGPRRAGGGGSSRSSVRATVAVTADTTLAYAREQVMSMRDEGVVCPACDQFCKTYTRSITGEMARCLLLLYLRLDDSNEWFHAPSFFTAKKANSSNDAAMLRHWGLVEIKKELRRDGSDRSGLWRLTDKGRAFALNTLRLPKYVLMYNAERLGYLDTETVSIIDALGKHFNYQEIMGRAVGSEVETEPLSAVGAPPAEASPEAVPGRLAA